eukprot:scaffold198722_cov38-Tisochrysis_lutea.AAC.4
MHHYMDESLAASALYSAVLPDASARTQALARRLPRRTRTCAEQEATTPTPSEACGGSAYFTPPSPLARHVLNQ